MRCNLAEGKAAEADAFCERFTTDYLRWRIIRQDLTIPGIYKFAMTGAEDRVEFTVNSTTAITRVFARHYDFIDSLSVRLDTIANTTCDTCTGGGGGPELCPRVSNVTCTAGMMVVSYQLQCEAVTEPVGQPPAGGPVGTIAMWSVAPVPDGWLECNGQSFDATVYPELFVALGGNNWNVPDLRDKFVRGHGVTGKGSLRDSKPYKTGAPVNPFVAGSGGSHSHTNAPGTPIMVAPGTSGMTITGYTNTGNTSTAPDHTHTITGGDSETVPEHIILKFIIKART
jgi:microcystin-dependent protein